MKSYIIPATTIVELMAVSLMQTDLISTKKEYSKPGSQLVPARKLYI